MTIVDKQQKVFCLQSTSYINYSKDPDFIQKYIFAFHIHCNYTIQNIFWINRLLIYKSIVDEYNKASLNFFHFNGAVKIILYAKDKVPHHDISL